MGWYKEKSFYAPTVPVYGQNMGPEGKNVIFKTPKQLVKRLFVGPQKKHTTQNKRMKMQKTSHFKPVRAGLKTLKREPFAPHTACELASAHCDTTLRFPNLPEPGLNTDALCLLLK